MNELNFGIKCRDAGTLYFLQIVLCFIIVARTSDRYISSGANRRKYVKIYVGKHIEHINN